MATILTKLIQSITPPPVVTTEKYDGVEYRWRYFAIRPAFLKENLQHELYLLSFILLVILLAFYGKYYTSNVVHKWFDAHLPIFSQQFSKPTNDGLTQDGSSDFFNFSTGRRGIASLHTVFTMRPRHDFFQYAWQTSRTFVDLYYRPRDEIELDFTLPPGTTVPDFVWAIVAKDELLSIKHSRWDLTFTKTSDVPSLPVSLSVMSEYADVTDTLLRPSGSFHLSKVFSENPAILPYFRSLSVTDQPRERPTSGPIPVSEREKHVILSLTPPPASQADATLPLVTAVFTFIDSLSKCSLRPETKAKLKKTREELDVKLREEAERDKKEEMSQAAEDKKTAKRKAEEARISRLSAAEQQKVLEKERKRSLRKQQGKVVRK